MRNIRQYDIRRLRETNAQPVLKFAKRLSFADIMIPGKARPIRVLLQKFDSLIAGQYNALWISDSYFI
jgi:hypothetical protein